MAHPKRRQSGTRTALRRSQDALRLRTASECPQCGAPVIPHRVCKTCGYYRGKQVVMVKVKEDKKKK